MATFCVNAVRIFFFNRPLFFLLFSLDIVKNFFPFLAFPFRFFFLSTGKKVLTNQKPFPLFQKPILETGRKKREKKEKVV